MSETSEFQPRAPRARWFQFRLTTLLLGMLVAALCIGWWIERTRRPDLPELPSVKANRLVGSFRVFYTVGRRYGSSSYSSSARKLDVVAIDFYPTYVVLHQEGGAGTIVQLDTNTSGFRWQRISRPSQSH